MNTRIPSSTTGCGVCWVDQGDLVAGVAQARRQRPVEGADPATGDGVQVAVNQRDAHGSPPGVQALAEGFPFRFQQRQPLPAELTVGQLGVQAQLAGEHHGLVEQERHLDPGLAH